jgi:cytochrome c
MFSCLKACLASILFVLTWGAQAQTASSPYPGVGRLATAKEVQAWDIDVRPDFKGLPAGSGSVEKGQEVWEARCASCHGVFGESNEVFSPLIGGTSKEDIQSGRVANLSRSDYPGRTTMMKVATLSTLWDYINRAMPWNNPKTLKVDEVYAVLAYMLNLANVVPDDFVLSQQNMHQVQARMPNRHGMSTQHMMWPGQEFSKVSKPDVRNVACMSNCAAEPNVGSYLPDFAVNAHGNLYDQNRLVGPQRGQKTDTKDTKAGGALASPAPKENPAVALLKKNNCLACHGMDKALVGPSFTDVAKKHAGKVDYLAKKIKSGGSGVWGSIPMPAQDMSDNELKAIAEWISTGAKP